MSSGEPIQFRLDGNQRDWILENQSGPSTHTAILETAAMFQNVYARNNQHLKIRIEPKVNTVTFENCDHVTLVLNHVICSLELLNCTNCELQVLGNVSTVTLHKCTNLQMYFSYSSRNVQLTTCYINGVVAYYQKFEEDTDEWIELAVPSQYLHYLAPKSNSLVTKASPLYD